MKIIPYALIAATTLGGCAGNAIPPEVFARADYGTKPPANYQELVKQDFAETLIDPTSPLYRFTGEPTKGYTQPSRIFNTSLMFGWKVCGTVNSKNRMGGYTGSVPFFVLFKDGKVAYRLIGEVPTNQYNFSLTNGAINNACTR